jgi:tRNA(fMet)-specific endonuclease VapC
MNILLDTNVILYMVRVRDYASVLRLIIPENSKIYISVVSEAEVKSFAIRNNWREKRMLLLNNVLSLVEIIDVNQSSVNIYAEIDTYSQRINPKFEKYPFATPRNMGKNDLWIASLPPCSG